MLKVFFLFILLGVSKSILAQEVEENVTTYDSSFAAKTGADDYGMKRYVVAFLKRGKNTSLDSAERSKVQMLHLKNIMKMSAEGKLIMAGPFLDEGETRGIYIFDVSDLEEARKLTATDPAIKARVLEMELRPWYGSAALTELSNLHKRIQKKTVAD